MVRYTVAGRAATRPEVRSDLPTVVGPMEQRLALTRPASVVSRVAVALYLPDVPAYRLPAPDLSPVLIRDSPAHVIAAVPLEPASGIVRMQPSLLAPDRERLTGMDAVVIERAVAPARRELGALEPIRWKFLHRVSHVLPA